MIHEIAEIDVIPGSEDAFAAAVTEAAPHFRSARGCRSFTLDRSIEQPQHFFLTVGWDSVEDHMVHFRESPAFQLWRQLVGPYFEGMPRVSHVERVIEAF